METPQAGGDQSAFHFEGEFQKETDRMTTQRVACPECSSVLVLPPGCGGRYVRCGNCHHRFLVPTVGAVTEDDVAAWLNEGEEDQAAAPSVSQAVQSPKATATATQAHAPPRKPIATGPIRVVNVDRAGVMFEFPANRLHEAAFRCAMPHRCLRCGAKAHLEAHVIRYYAQAMDVSLKAEHEAGELVLHEHEIRGLSDEQVLNRLPKVPNATPPADLPMPYWLCDMCSGSGIIRGEISITSDAGRGRCRLWIQPLRRAEEFLACAGGRGTEGHQKLVELIESTAESPWDRLAMVVQDRIQQWFTPKQDETFVAYIPDRDHTRTEDGVAGLLVSTQRLIYHTRTRHREQDIHTRMEMQLAMTGPRGHLEISVGDWRVKRFAIDHDGVQRLRRALTHVKSPAVWV